VSHTAETKPSSLVVLRLENEVNPALYEYLPPSCLDIQFTRVYTFTVLNLAKHFVVYLECTRFSQGMLAIVRCRIFCLPVYSPKMQR
jgi:hypothetical protein